MSSTSTPKPMMIPSWPGSLPPFGYNPAGVPSVRGAIPMDANAAIPNALVVMLSQPRPNRCATHLLIACLIHYQQQLERLNPFWHAAALYGAKPYNMNILPQSDVLLCGNSAIRSPNNVTNNGLVTGSVVTINGQNPKEKASNSFTDAHKKQPQQPGDPTLQMGMKGVDLAGPVPLGHRMLQPLPDIGHNHYQLGNLSKVSANPAKALVARSSNKPTESSHSPSIASAGQQQQVVSHVKPTVSSASVAVVPGTVAYSDRLSVAYTGPNFPTRAMGFPNMQNPLQWKMQSSQRVVQVGPPGNTLAQSPTAALAISNAGSIGGKGSKLPSPTLNSSQKVMRCTSDQLLAVASCCH